MLRVRVQLFTSTALSIYETLRGGAVLHIAAPFGGIALGDLNMDSSQLQPSLHSASRATGSRVSRFLVLRARCSPVVI